MDEGYRSCPLDSISCTRLLTTCTALFLQIRSMAPVELLGSAPLEELYVAANKVISCSHLFRHVTRPILRLPRHNDTRCIKTMAQSLTNATHIDIVSQTCGRCPL